MPLGFRDHASQVLAGHAVAVSSKDLGKSDGTFAVGFFDELHELLTVPGACFQLLGEVIDSRRLVALFRCAQSAFADKRVGIFPIHRECAGLVVDGD